MHGGCSTGATSAEGIERISNANWIHGGYSAKAKKSRHEAHQVHRRMQRLIRSASLAVSLVYKKPRKV